MIIMANEPKQAVKPAAKAPPAKPAKAPVAAATPVAKSVEKKSESTGRIAIVLIRNRTIGVRHDVVRALDNLRLGRRHICAVFPDNASTRGLMFKCKDLTTYGPISEEMFKLLNEKRGSLKDREGKLLNVFRMHPPRGGYGNKGIKVSYQEGGCLGLRRKEMDAFLAKML
jgi:ribosomal protein L30/L7E